MLENEVEVPNPAQITETDEQKVGRVYASMTDEQRWLVSQARDEGIHTTLRYVDLRLGRKAAVRVMREVIKHETKEAATDA